MSLLLGCEFLNLGGVFLGVKDKSKNFGNKIGIRFLNVIKLNIYGYALMTLKYFDF